MRDALTVPARVRLAVLACLASVAAVLAPVPTAGADEGDRGPGGRSTAPPAADGDTTSVTLVTGDRVVIRNETGGRRSITFEPGAGRDHVQPHQLEIDGQLYVFPLDVLPYVSEDRVDRDLFNVDALVEQGYDDASLDTVPLIATTGGSTRTLSALAAVDPGPTLQSIDGQALAVAKDDAAAFWESVTGAGRVRLAAGIEKLWLDGRVEADLDQSVAQIGAPSAWEAGYDGTGVTVAVLDTGVDAAHPDLAGRVAAEANFTTTDSTQDRVGHGTHVAATIAGTGAGSDGTRRGVAPGAEIVSGKVLDDEGSGWESDVIEGMEWAVAQDADVVNMSLGGGPTDGTDPLSTAVDELSAEGDALFVVSAGNEGPGGFTIGAPGAADSALTVGAVDRDDTLADFSSRGPRVGDLAIKPDITAPGVDIVAARASGTSMGSPVDALYTRASGTSMAAPHVAGAAALLAVQHPHWTGEQLKDALISTAVPGDLTEYEQGGGRVDVTRAVEQGVYGTGTINLGDLTPDSGKVNAQVTWTNTTDAPVELRLELDVTDVAGNPPAAGALTLGADTVTVPAGSSASVPLTADAAVLGSGRYAGQLVATSGDTTVHTTVGVVRSAPRHEVTFEARGFDGEQVPSPLITLFGEDPRFDTLTFIRNGDASRTVELGAGDYLLHALLTPDYYEEDSLVSFVDPDLEITGDRTIVLDARETSRVEIETPRPATPRGNLGFSTRREAWGRTITHQVQEFDSTTSIWVTPTEQAKGGYFEWMSRWQLGEPLVTATTSGPRPLRLMPRLERESPTIDRVRQLRLVAAGDGRPEDYEGLDVAGRIAVVSPPDKGAEDVAAAAAAGAAMMLILPPRNNQWWTKYTGRGERLPIPVIVVSPRERDLLVERMRSGPVTLTVSGVAESSYTYDVVHVEKGRVPQRVAHTVSPRNSATITADYHDMGGEPWSKEQRFFWRPWQETSIVESQQELRTPQRRSEVISSGSPDTLWRQHVLHFFSWDLWNPISGGAVHALRTYLPGERVAQDWWAAVVRPAAPAGTPPTRTADGLDIRIAELAGRDATTYARAWADETTMELYEDGELLVSGDEAWDTYTATKAAADYQLHLGVTRETDPDWEHSTRTDTTWEFRSERPRTGSAQLPLLQVGYDVPVGPDNRAAGGRVGRLAFTVGYAGGASSARLRDLAAWASYDDGASWRRLDLRGADGSWSAVLRHPAAGHVSLRVRAVDSDGNSVDQTVLRAYGITPDA